MINDHHFNIYGTRVALLTVWRIFTVNQSVLKLHGAVRPTRLAFYMYVVLLFFTFSRWIDHPEAILIASTSQTESLLQV